MILKKIATLERILKEKGEKGLVAACREKMIDWVEKGYRADSVSYEKALKWFARRRECNAKLVEAVAPYVSRYGTIFDIGANIGYFTSLLAAKIDFRGAAYFFEPVPNLAKCCRRTFFDAPFRAEVHNFGLGDVDGEMDLYLASGNNIGWNTLIADKASSDMNRLRVKVKAFDAAGIRAVPTFIKIDVEGAEYMVFRGMLESMRKWRPLPTILCEVGWGRAHPRWAEEVAVFRELEKLGYDFFTLEKEKIDISGLERTADIIFVPRKEKSKRQRASVHQGTYAHAG